MIVHAVAVAHADAITNWTILQDALLDEAVDGDVEGATAQYEMLVRTLAADDPLRGEALYRLARARVDVGDASGAREALREALRTGGGNRAACIDLLDAIELGTNGVAAVPARFAFDLGPRGLVHPHALADIGGVEVVVDATHGALLEWRTSAEARGDDRLVLGVAPGVPVRSVRFRALSPTGDARLLLEGVDERGAAIAYPAVDLPEGTWVSVELPVSTPLDRLLFGRPPVAGDSLVRIDDLEVW